MGNSCEEIKTRLQLLLSSKDVEQCTDEHIKKAYETGKISIATAKEISVQFDVPFDVILDLPQGPLFQCKINELLEEEQDKFERDTRRQFHDELRGLIERHAYENKLSYFETIGALVSAAMDEWAESRGIFDDVEEE